MGSLKRIWQSDTGEDIVTTTYVVHSFRLSDVDDPDVYAGQPIYEWQESDAGKWVMQHAIEKPSWHRNFDICTYGYNYQIRAELTPEQITYFKLRFE